ncbi:hypothetical protein GCM10010448_38280 [Streptomyces glomeratus]|uniref:Uncharacterized protein n=1 Tax=Streptomyces glomeratus TaxID=284452 RepID=A0ABP6LN24_9ACTN
MRYGVSPDTLGPCSAGAARRAAPDSPAETATEAWDAVSAAIAAAAIAVPLAPLSAPLNARTATVRSLPV